MGPNSEARAPVDAIQVETSGYAAMSLFVLPFESAKPNPDLPGWGIGNREAPIAAFAKSAGNG